MKENHHQNQKILTDKILMKLIKVMQINQQLQKVVLIQPEMMMMMMIELLLNDVVHVKRLPYLNKLVNHHQQLDVIRVEKLLIKQNLIFHQCVSLNLMYNKKKR
jgi:hypothetical protein